MQLIDSHAHLQSEAFANDAGEVLETARSAGVVRVLVPGWDLASSVAAVEMAQSHHVNAAVGIHPHVSTQAVTEWPLIEQRAIEGSVVAIGETGLDYDRGFSPHQSQLDNLRHHLALSREAGKPVILHCRSRKGERDAHDDLLRELTEAGAGTPSWPTDAGRPPALLHSFSGPVDYAERALEMGLAISFSGLVFRKGEEASAEVARLVPADRLLVETDSPYLPPPGAPRKRNEPRWVEVTARWLAEQRGADADELGRQLVANYDRMFSRRPT